MREKEIKGVRSLFRDLPQGADRTSGLYHASNPRNLRAVIFLQIKERKSTLLKKRHASFWLQTITWLKVCRIENRSLQCTALVSSSLEQSDDIHGQPYQISP